MFALAVVDTPAAGVTAIVASIGLWVVQAAVALRALERAREALVTVACTNRQALADADDQGFR